MSKITRYFSYFYNIIQCSKIESLEHLRSITSNTALRCGADYRLHSAVTQHNASMKRPSVLFPNTSVSLIMCAFYCYYNSCTGHRSSLILHNLFCAENNYLNIYLNIERFTFSTWLHIKLNYNLFSLQQFGFT